MLWSLQVLRDSALFLRQTSDFLPDWPALGCSTNRRPTSVLRQWLRTAKFSARRVSSCCPGKRLTFQLRPNRPNATSEQGEEEDRLCGVGCRIETLGPVAHSSPGLA